MFSPGIADIQNVLAEFDIRETVKSVSELERYHYERDNPDSRELRLIVRVDFEAAPPLVIRFRNEADVPPELIESQCRFAKALRDNGIRTPEQFQSGGSFVRMFRIGGYDAAVTVERFAENELKVVDVPTAEKTGRLLAEMHGISEENGLHVNGGVLFDPFSRNDLFDFAAFQSIGDTLEGEDRALFDAVTEKYREHMELLSPLKARPRYAVQGDISDCNLYYTDGGELGVFDFNRSGDSVLFCDAVMQAVFESRLMDYPEDREAGFESDILAAFLRGYCSVRPFSEEERRLYPHLCAVINAFWSDDIRWREDGLVNSCRNGDSASVRRWLETIWERVTKGSL